MESFKYCSNCGSRRALNEFPVNKQGKLAKTCSKHLKKRKQPTFDSWDDFLVEIRCWNRPSQTNKLSVNYVFQMDELPVVFGSRPELQNDGTYDNLEMNEAMNMLADLISTTVAFDSEKEVHLIDV